MDTNKKNLIQILVGALIIAVLVALRLAAPEPARAAIIRVPQDQRTIQRAINVAQNGDIILVSPGTYQEQLVIAGKEITLASLYHSTGDEKYIAGTVIDAKGGVGITIEASAGQDTSIIGLTITNGNDGIRTFIKSNILHNRFINNGDALDFTSSSGYVAYNYFQFNIDDAIDLDNTSEAVIEHNTILDNGDDGIEIRLHPYSGPLLRIIIRENTIIGNGEDGIQLVDYADNSSRAFYIERNLIANNAKVGIGLMDNGVTLEDMRGAPIPERVHIYNNTFSGNPYAITGGANLIALNNLITNCPVLGLKNLTGSSIAAYNMYWSNLSDFTNSLVDLPSSLFNDPMLDASYHLLAGSLAFDAGTASFIWNGETVLDMSPEAYVGAGPDIGAYESDSKRPSTTPTSTSQPSATSSPTSTVTPTPSVTPLPGEYTRFAVIGDYGKGNQGEADVAALVKNWNPDFIVTVGDNNYPDGETTTIDLNIGKDYHEFIYPYFGSYGAGAITNRFFPSLGNHDLHTNYGQAYYDFFTLPGNERYYQFVQGPLHLFILNSDNNEPDGNSSTSAQAVWLQTQLAASTSAWNIVAFHHPPYSSGLHGSSIVMRWPLKEWGADAILSGHDHTYERLSVNELPYFVNGLGGAGIYDFIAPLAESQMRYNTNLGAMLVQANSTRVIFEFYAVTGQLIDSYTITTPHTQKPTFTPTPTATATPTPTPKSAVILNYQQWLPFIAVSP